LAFGLLQQAAANSGLRQQLALMSKQKTDIAGLAPNLPRSQAKAPSGARVAAANPQSRGRKKTLTTLRPHGS
jgi:hypothetical protein